MKGGLEESGERELVGMLTKAIEFLPLDRLEGSLMLTKSTLLQVQGEWHLPAYPEVPWCRSSPVYALSYIGKGYEIEWENHVL